MTGKTVMSETGNDLKHLRNIADKEPGECTALSPKNMERNQRMTPFI